MAGVFSETGWPMSIRVLPVSTSTMLGFQMHTPMLGIKLIILQKTLMNWAEASPLPLLALLLMYMWHYKSFHVFEGKFYVVITVLFLIVHLRQYSTLWPLPALLTQSSYLSILSARIAAVHHHAWLGTGPFFSFFPVQFVMDFSELHTSELPSFTVMMSLCFVRDAFCYIDIFISTFSCLLVSFLPWSGV